MWDCAHDVFNFFPSQAVIFGDTLREVLSVKAHSVLSVLRKAGDVLSPVISAFAIGSFSHPVPALQQAVTRCFPACRKFRIYFCLAESGNEGSSLHLLSSAPCLRLAPLAMGLAML